MNSRQSGKEFFVKMNQRIKLTKSLLKNALVEMLKTESIHKISIRDLCEKAGINRSTFYKHYKDQYNLMLEIENDYFEEIDKLLSRPSKNSAEYITKILEKLEDNIDMSRLLFNLVIDPEFKNKMFTKTKLRETIKGYKAEAPAEIFEYLFAYHTSGIHEIICCWINKDKRENPKAIATLIIDLCSRPPQGVNFANAGSYFKV